MDINNLLLKDPNTNSPSTARSVFFYGCAICLIKLLLSGISVYGFNLGVFSGGDFALAIGALGGIYSLDKAVSKKDGVA